MVPEEEGGQSAAPHLLPATEHTPWLGAHVPEALQPRASGTTGAAAPSSRGPGAGSREAVVRVEPLPLAHAGLGAGSRMTCAVPAMPGRLRGSSQVTGPPRPASARSGQPVTGSEFGVRWCSGQHLINENSAGEEGQTTHKSAVRDAQQ